MDQLNLSVIYRDDAAIIELSGELTATGIGQLTDTVRQAAAHAGHIVLDAGRLICCDPFGIHAIGHAHQAASEAGATLAAADLQPLVATGMLLTDGADAVPVYDTVTGALAGDDSQQRADSLWPLPAAPRAVDAAPRPSAIGS